MGKRSEFKRIDKDFYRTIDPRAVAALLPHIEHVKWYLEPFAGQGDLIRELARNGKTCAYACDKHMAAPNISKADCFNGNFHYNDIVITNPPWSRDILHKAIDFFGSRCETWFLFDADWAHTKQSSELMKRYCTDIVSIGRLIWIEGTNTSGKDNCAWYRFHPVNTNRHGLGVDE